MWTSARRRAYHTAWPFVRLGYKVTEKPQMGEINVSSSALCPVLRSLTHPPRYFVLLFVLAWSVGWFELGGGQGGLPGRVGALPQGSVRPPSTSSRVVPRPVRFVPLPLHHPCSRLLRLILLIITALTVRLESVIFELERCQDDLLIIGHASVIRCLVRHSLASTLPRLVASS